MTVLKISVLVALLGAIGEKALSWVDVPRVAVPFSAVGLPMPKGPLQGQRKPPCKRGEREINGACWKGPIEGETPPCGEEMVDHEGRCYFASGDPLRQPTSEDPR